jgi:hypothetical protein
MINADKQKKNLLSVKKNMTCWRNAGWVIGV